MKSSRPFTLISRLLLIGLLALVWVAPPVYASTVECVEDNGVWDCSLDVDGTDGIDLLFTLNEATTVTFTTYTSLTCNDHGTGQGTDEYRADPYLYLYDDEDTLVAQDDDSAAHNVNGMCWDAHIEIVDLAAGTYRLNANVYEEEYGVYSMDISGVAAFDGEEPEPTPTPQPTPTPTPTPEPTPTPTPEPTPEPIPTPTETPTPSPTPTPTPLPTPQPTPEPPPPLPTPTPEATATPTAPPALPVLEEEPPFDDSTIFDDIDYEDWDFDDWDVDTEPDDLPPIEEVINFEDFDDLENIETETDFEEPGIEEEESQEETAIDDTESQEEPEQTLEEPEQDLEDIFTEDEIEELEEEEIELLEELLDDPDIDEQLVEELEELFDEEEITEAEIDAITENEDFEELPTEARQQIVEAVNESTDIAVKESFEENVDVFSSADYSNYVQVGSSITVEDRKTVIVAAVAITTATTAARIRPTATASTSHTGPTRTRTRRSR